MCCFASDDCVSMTYNKSKGVLNADDVTALQKGHDRWHPLWEPYESTMSLQWGLIKQYRVIWGHHDFKVQKCQALDAVVTPLSVWISMCGVPRHIYPLGLQWWVCPSEKNEKKLTPSKIDFLSNYHHWTGLWWFGPFLASQGHLGGLGGLCGV